MKKLLFASALLDDGTEAKRASNKDEGITTCDRTDVGIAADGA